MDIRRATSSDRDAVWAILEPVIRAGETYPLPRDMSEAEALAYWFSPGHDVYAGRIEGEVAGTYFLRANQQGGGAHVANCGYVTSARFLGRGLARAMCVHSMDDARAGGFRAMQFNFVVSSNVGAVHLWSSLGFATVGRLPGAFLHPALGAVDALVMFRELEQRRVMTQALHSAGQFTASRDHWWNGDFLDLMAARLNLPACRNVLELGAGQGHWTEQIAARCAADARFTVVDKEREWVAALRKRFPDRPQFEVVEADVTVQPPLGGGYDLITCQTLLMHLTDVPAVLTWAYGLLAPGGLVLLAEPNNFANRLDLSTVSAGLSPAELGQVAALWWAFERGREALGLGQEWISVRLPQLLSEAKFIDIEVFNNDRPVVLTPPYKAAAERSVVSDWLMPPRRREDAGAREETRRLALAGGLDEAAFERAWELLCQLDERELAALEARTLAACGGGNLHLFAGRKAVR